MTNKPFKNQKKLQSNQCTKKRKKNNTVTKIALAITLTGFNLYSDHN